MLMAVVHHRTPPKLYPKYFGKLTVQRFAIVCQVGLEKKIFNPA
jgi:hypothetical protein